MKNFIKTLILSLFLAAVAGVSPLVAMKRSPVDDLNGDSKKQHQESENISSDEDYSDGDISGPMTKPEWEWLRVNHNDQDVVNRYVVRMQGEDFDCLAAVGVLHDSDELIRIACQKGSPLLNAVVEGDVQKVQALCLQGERVNCYHLLIALKRNQKDLFDLVLAQKPVFEKSLLCGTDVLSSAIYSQYQNVESYVDALVKAGYEVKTKHVFPAIESNNMQLLFCILNASCIDKDVIPAVFNWALKNPKYTAIHQNPTLFEFIIKKGVDVDVSHLERVCDYGYKIENDTVVFSENCKAVLKLLAAQIKGMNTILFEGIIRSKEQGYYLRSWILQGECDKVENLLQQNMNIDQPIGKSTPITLALAKGSPEMVALLLAYGARFPEEMIDEAYGGIDSYGGIDWCTNGIKALLRDVNYVANVHAKIVVPHDSKLVVSRLNNDFENKRYSFFKLLLPYPHAAEDFLHLSSAPCYWLDPKVSKKILGKDKNENPVLKVVSDKEWLVHELEKNAHRNTSDSVKDMQRKKLYQFFVVRDDFKKDLHKNHYTDVVINNAW